MALVMLLMVPSGGLSIRRENGRNGAGWRGEGGLVSQYFRQLDRRAVWRQTAAIPLRFNTHHPQGMVRVGDDFYLSTVEVIEQTKRSPQASGHDRSAGAGFGHLIRFGIDGRPHEDLRLGEGTIYHPGGIDYDGRHIWVPVAEYRPDSRSIIYRIDPHPPLVAAEVWRLADHLGGLIHRRTDQTLHAISWGSRWFYQLTPRTGQVRRRPNPSFYIDYQDCHYLGGNQMICGGLRNYEDQSTGQRLSLGGLELIDLTTGSPLHQLPVEHWSRSGRPMTQNPFWIAPLPAPRRGLQLWFIPDDRDSTLYGYEVTPAEPAGPPGRPSSKIRRGI
jgi:hypothetical protein